MELQLPNGNLKGGSSAPTPTVVKIIEYLREYEAPYSKGILTQTRLNIIEQLLRGKSNKEISAQLRFKVNLIKWHLTIIYKYFNIDNRRSALICKLYNLI